RPQRPAPSQERPETAVPACWRQWRKLPLALRSSPKECACPPRGRDRASVPATRRGRISLPHRGEVLARLPLPRPSGAELDVLDTADILPPTVRTRYRALSRQPAISAGGTPQ